jgi:hypothetical protein
MKTETFSADPLKVLAQYEDLLTHYLEHNLIKGEVWKPRVRLSQGRGYQWYHKDAFETGNPKGPFPTKMQACLSALSEYPHEHPFEGSILKQQLKAAKVKRLLAAWKIINECGTAFKGERQMGAARKSQLYDASEIDYFVVPRFIVRRVGDKIEWEPTDNKDEAQIFSVSLHLKTGGTENFADFPTFEEAWTVSMQIDEFCGFSE